MKAGRRTYRQSARAAATQETRERILQAARAEFLTRWFDEVTLADIAASAGVSVQTVVNHVGGKEGLIDAMVDRFRGDIEAVRYRAAPGDVAAAVDALLDDYEETGDAIWRALALEQRYPALGHLLATGRAAHRAWVEQTFAPTLGDLGDDERTRRVVLLVAATDVYTWKLMRRDMAMSRAAVASAMREALEILTHPITTQGRSR